MPDDKRSIQSPQLFGVTESSATLSFEVCSGTDVVDAEAHVRIDGQIRATSSGSAGTRLVRITGLSPDTEYAVSIETDTGATAEPGRYFPDTLRTLPAPDAAEVASFATLNDLHFGESRLGGVLTKEHEYGDAAPGFPVVSDDDYDTPYAEFMNADAIAEINRIGVDATIIKGDIADGGLESQFETAAKTFSALESPHHAFLGNHDFLMARSAAPVDGYALLGQEPAPRTLELGGWKLVLLDTTIPGDHEGALGRERLEWLADVLADSRAEDTPTLLFAHHQPVPPEHRDSYPNSIGLDSDDSMALLDLLGHAPQVKGMLIGHTHRNRVRRYPETGALPFAEVANSKDYPGAFGHYRLFEDGHFRQEVQRTPSERALLHSTRCRGLFNGFYEHFTFGTLEERSYVAGGKS